MPNEKESCCTPIEEKCVVFYAFDRYRAKKNITYLNLRYTHVLLHRRACIVCTIVYIESCMYNDREMLKKKIEKKKNFTDVRYRT